MNSKKGVEKKVILGILILGTIIVSMSFVSASFWSNLFSRDSNQEGELPEQAVANVRIQDTNPPIVVFVSDVVGEIPTFTNLVTLKSRTGSPTLVKFSFLAQQGGNQAGNLVPIASTSSAGDFSRTGELTRTNLSCMPASLTPISWNGGTAVNYTCTIAMNYYDGNGTWTINATVVDNFGRTGSNLTKTFTVNPTFAASTIVDYINWTNPSLTTADTDRLSDNNITISNDGNVPYTLTRVNATDLNGTSVTDQYIPTDRFLGNGCGGTTLQNNQALLISGFTAARAVDDAGQETDLSFCISSLSGGPTPLSSQTYQSSRDWIINFPNS